MNEFKLTELATDLFKQELITHVELRKFKEEEKAINKLLDFKMNVNEKREKLEMKKLENLSNRINASQNLILKIKNIDVKNSKVLDLKKSMFIELLMNLVIGSTKEMLEDYSNILPLELKENLKLSIEYKN